MLKTIVNDTQIPQTFYDQWNQPHHLKPGESKAIDVQAPVEEEIITITAGAKKIKIGGAKQKGLTLIIKQEEI